MNITPKTVYRELHAALDPLMKQHGFSNIKTDLGFPGWTRQSRPPSHSSVWFQCDKWGWDENWGSKFTLEFEEAPAPFTPTAQNKRERIGYLLEGFAELDELRIRNNSVIERLPGTLNGSLVTVPCDDGSEIVVTGERIDTGKAVYGRDIWLNYYSVEDVRAWASYFTGNLLRFIDIFESGMKNQEGKARERFNQMMSAVQRTNSLTEKANILARFIGSETDATFKANAATWQDALHNKIQRPA